MTKKKIDKRVLAKLPIDIPEDQKENLLCVVGDFVFNLQKKELIQDFKEQDFEALSQAICCITYVSEPELEIVQKTKEYIEVYGLLKESKKVGKLNNKLFEIYDVNRKNAKNWLHLKRGRLVKEILGNQFTNYQKIKNKYPDKAQKIFTNKLQTANATTKEIYDLVNQDLLLFDKNPLFLKLTPTILKGKIDGSDILAYVSFLLLHPKHQLSSFLQLDDEWEKFPLKWYASHQPIPFMKALFFYHKNGHDVSEHFVQKYEDNDFEQIIKLTKSHYLLPPNSHILCSRSKIINDVIKCYENKIWSAVICSSLSLIEGLLWDFSTHIQQREGGIYINAEQNKILSKNGNEISDVTIGSLLQHSLLNKIFDKYFIRYFCDELYNERNPILHGKNVSNFNEKNAAKKLATIEYLLETINGYNENFMMKNLENKIPEDMKKSILDTIKKRKKNV